MNFMQEESWSQRQYWEEAVHMDDLGSSDGHDSVTTQEKNLRSYCQVDCFLFLFLSFRGNTIQFYNHLQRDIVFISMPIVLIYV